jgi:hypothetical protein
MGTMCSTALEILEKMGIAYGIILGVEALRPRNSEIRTEAIREV